MFPVRNDDGFSDAQVERHGDHRQKRKRSIKSAAIRAQNVQRAELGGGQFVRIGA
jgi:hypothetical protein